jgi:4-diphosphocytidyl-2-C-methyl-D-erythritol kinase
MTTLQAPAKINLALVVGPRRPDGKHELVTVYERLDLADTIRLEPGPGIDVSGFSGDTLVVGALELLARRAGVPARWAVAIDKHIPVAAGLGGGSSDAASALRLANETLDRPLDDTVLHDLAAGLGADVPFFLTGGPQLGEGDGTELSQLQLPRDYGVVLLLPGDVRKSSTKVVYDAFDDRRGEVGFAMRREALLAALDGVDVATDLASLPRNDLAQSPLVAELECLGAFRADVSGAGPTVYGLFRDDAAARAAASELGALGRVWVTAPAWYG